MRLTTRGRLAVAAMIDLALRRQSAPVSLAAISQRQQISMSYLEQLFAKLRRHRLVQATRGPGGGYSLGRECGEITIADIIVAVDKAVVVAGGGDKADPIGDDAGRCLTHELWAGLNAKLIECLESVSLQELVDEQIARGVSIEAAPLKRGISPRPVLEPIRVSAPNSVFALGNAWSK